MKLNIYQFQKFSNGQTADTHFDLFRVFAFASRGDKFGVRLRCQFHLTFDYFAFVFCMANFKPLFKRIATNKW